jgi:hypothetical protein
MKPQIVDNSVTILSKAGLGMAMFSLGKTRAVLSSISVGSFLFFLIFNIKNHSHMYG